MFTQATHAISDKGGGRRLGAPTYELNLSGHINDDIRAYCRDFITGPLVSRGGISRGTQYRAETVASELLLNIAMHSKGGDGAPIAAPEGVVRVTLNGDQLWIETKAPVTPGDFVEITNTVKTYQGLTFEERRKKERELMLAPPAKSQGMGLGLLAVVSDAREVSVTQSGGVEADGRINCHIRALV